MTKTGASLEFIAEAQEIVDALNRDLIAAAAAVGAAGYVEIDPEIINDLFRSAHSLKGISGMFGLESITRLAHALENVLDSTRMGRTILDANAFDVLFTCVERFAVMIAEASLGQEAKKSGLAELIGRLDDVVHGDPGKRADPLPLVGFGEDVLCVLTEYEEHRLRENVRRGRGLFVVRSSFDLTSFDLGLAKLDAAVRNLGEVITKLPRSNDATGEAISFDIVVGSDYDWETLRSALGDNSVEVLAVDQRDIPGAGWGDGSPSGMTHNAHRSRDVSAPSLSPDKVGAADAGPPVQVEQEGESEASQGLKSASQTVRVDIRRLDHLMNLVGELALTRTAFQCISDMMKQEQGFSLHSAELHKESRKFERRLAELQAGIMEVRMVPVANLFERLVRAGRKIGRELGRELRIEVSGEQTELDKLIVEDLAIPLMHLVRNSIDHGIEPPAVRIASGKSGEGVVMLSAAAQGNHVIFEVSDDGCGIDTERTLQTAIERGLIAPERAREMTRREIFNLLYLPGFSTRSDVSEYSGRGVGMDVVKNNISRLSGIIDIDSTEGRGTRVAIMVPITLAIIPALIVSVSGRTYAIPLNNVMETIALDQAEIRTIERREVINVRGSTIPLVDLRSVFQFGDTPRPDMSFGVIAGVGQNRMAVAVDQLVGQQDIVIKSLGRRLRNVPGIAGATELGSHQTILVIDTVELLNELSGGAG